jgi:hypothetical protein
MLSSHLTAKPQLQNAQLYTPDDYRTHAKSDIKQQMSIA